jgi:hypothetical protein
VEAAFQTLEEALCTAPVLAYSQPRERLVLDTDASNIEIGEVLSQIEDGQERVMTYYCKTLNKAKRNYCVARRELQAIVRMLEHFRKYRDGQEFTCAPTNLR